MKLITRDTDYAIRALCYVAKKKKSIVCVNDMVRVLKIPKPFLRKILQILNKKRILKSYKGKGGGFVLTRSPQKIFIMELVKIFQGPIILTEHFFKKTACPNIKTCLLKKKIDAIQERVIVDLKSTTIASLIK